MVWHAGMGTDASDRPAALVTGANRGLGLETSVQLRAKGFRVILTSRDEKKGTAAVRGLDPDGGDVLYHQLDITDRASISTVAKDLPALVPRLDLLVNNAVFGSWGADRRAVDRPRRDAARRRDRRILSGREADSLVRATPRNGEGERDER